MPVVILCFVRKIRKLKVCRNQRQKKKLSRPKQGHKRWMSCFKRHYQMLELINWRWQPHPPPPPLQIITTWQKQVTTVMQLHNVRQQYLEWVNWNIYVILLNSPKKIHCKRWSKKWKWVLISLYFETIISSVNSRLFIDRTLSELN